MAEYCRLPRADRCRRLRASNDDVYDLVVGVAAGHDAIDDIARNIKHINEGSHALPSVDPEGLRADIDAVIDQRL